MGGYLDFYKTTLPQQTYDTTWARLHDPSRADVAPWRIVDGKLLGIVHYLYHRSCWTAGDYCYLQDLFVAAEARKLGLGRALIEAVYREAKRRAQAACTGTRTRPMRPRGRSMTRSRIGRDLFSTGRCF